MTRPRIDSSVVDQIVELRRQGMTIQKIGEALGMHRATVENYVPAEYIGRMKASKSEAENIVRLWTQGMRIEAISARTKVSVYTAKRALHNHLDKLPTEERRKLKHDHKVHEKRPERKSHSMPPRSVWMPHLRYMEDRYGQEKIPSLPEDNPDVIKLRRLNGTSRIGFRPLNEREQIVVGMANAGVSQADIARKIGVGPASVHYIISRARNKGAVIKEGKA